MLKKTIVRILLRLLNSKSLNSSPCKYAFVGNLDNFSRENLESEDRQTPGITVKEMLINADRFKNCGKGQCGLQVIEGDTVREATVWDIHDLRSLGQ